MFNLGSPRSPEDYASSPGPAPPTPTGYFPRAFSPSSGLPQDVNLEANGSIPFSLAAGAGKLSPQKWNNSKDSEDYNRIKTENFNLKVRIYLLEEHMQKKTAKWDKDDLHKSYLELQVESEALKKQLYDKQELVRQAQGLLTTLEKQHEVQLCQLKTENEREKIDLVEKISQLEKELEHSDECGRLNTRDLTQLCGLAFGEDNTMTSLMGSAESVPQQGPSRQRGQGQLPGSLKGIFSIPDESTGEVLSQSLSPSKSQITFEEKVHVKELEKRVHELENRVVELEGELNEKEKASEALEEDLQNLKKELQDQEDKMADLEFEVTEKDQKVDQLMQDLETRRREIQDKDSTIQTLHDDLSKVEPEIEVKVQEIYERDRIIEEKTEQLTQQNKILVEIQITLDEKQKQISELESSLQQAQEKVHKIEEEFERACQTIKCFTDEVVTRDKEIAQLKKDLKKKEKKIRDLIAELKESYEALKKAKWEAQTNTGEDGMKEMVEEENERLWAELEQRKSEAANLRLEKEKAISEVNAKFEALEKRAQLAEELTKSLQSQLNDKNSKPNNERDKEPIHLEMELLALREKATSRENALKEQNGIIEHLKGELNRAKEELTDRKEEMKDLKKELSMKNADVQKFISEELFGRNKEVKDLQGRLCDLSFGQDKHLEALKLIFNANKAEMQDKETPMKSSQVQARSNSLSQIGIASTTDKDGSETPGQSRPTRSNSFSLLENALYAHMGQKVYNTNQTFNTYVIPGSAENKTNEATPLSESNVAIPCHATALKSSITAAFSHVNKKGNSPDLDKVDSIRVAGEPASSLPEFSTNLESSSSDENAIQILYDEMNKLRNEVCSLRKEREALTEKISSLQQIIGSPRISKDRDDNLNNQLTLLKTQLEDSQKEKIAKEQRHDKEVMDYHNQIQALKEELNSMKKRITLQVFELASRKYQDSVKNYKQEIASLRQRLADSHNACDLLRTRLEELVDFLEQILDMDKKGIINLSHLSSARRASLQKTLNDSRALSHSLSQSLMIGADSLLSESSMTDLRFSLPLDALPEEVELFPSASSTCHESSQFDLPDEISQLDLSFDFSSKSLNSDQLYQKITAALNKQIDLKVNDIDNVSSKLNQLGETILQKDLVIQEKAGIIVRLQNEIKILQDKSKHKDDQLRSHSQPPVKSPLSIQRSFPHQSSFGELAQRCPSIDVALNYEPYELASNRQISHLERQPSSAHLLSPSLSCQDNDSLSTQNDIFITQDGLCFSTNSGLPPQSSMRSSNNLLHPITTNVSSPDQEVEFYKDHHSDSTVLSAYSTDVMVKNLVLPQNSQTTLPKISPVGEQSIRNELASLPCTLEQPNTPALMLASPSESEAWSEPDRNVSLARIGLEACALATHDRSLSRARMNRSTPLSSESDAELNVEEVKEGTPASQAIPSGSCKTKRRSEAAEIKRLTTKLKNLEQLNETLRAELHINETLNQHFGVRKQETRSTQVCSKESPPENSDTTLETYKAISTEIALHEDSAAAATMTISAPLLQEIRSLRMKLEEAITNNDLLRDQLEAALAGYLSDEMRNLTSTLAAAQQELMQNKDQLIAASTTEHLLRSQCREAESKAYDLSESLADYITRHENLQKEIFKLNDELASLQSSINKKEEEVMSLRSLHAEETEQFNSNSAKIDQLQSDVANLQRELRSSQQNEIECERKLKNQSLYTSSLEHDKAELESRLAEQDRAITDLCNRITNLQKQNDSSSSSKIIQKLHESEAKLLQVTKERFALQSDKSRLQAQLASAKTHAKLLQKEIEELSDSERASVSSSSSLDVDYDRIAKRLRESQSNLKEIEKERSLWANERQALKNQLQLLQEEAMPLRVQVDHFRERAKELSSLNSSNKQLQEKLAIAANEKEILAEKLHLKEKQLQKLESLAVCENYDTAATPPLPSPLLGESFRPPLYPPSFRPSSPPSPHSLPLSEYVEGKRGCERDLQRKRKTSWAENKENLHQQPTAAFYRSPVHIDDGGVLKETALRSNIHHSHQQYSLDDDATSGESPDLGIGSDGGQFSSLERNVRGANTIISIKGQSNAMRLSQLCTDPSHSLLMQDNECLKMQNEKLSEKLAMTQENLRDAQDRMDRANKKKESVERAISRQLTKTADVLRRTRGTVRQSKCQSVPKGNSEPIK